MSKLGALDVSGIQQSSYLLPDWDAPLAIEQYRNNVPSDILVRGLFFEQVTALVQTRASNGFGNTKHSLYQNYPIHSFYDHLLLGAELSFPDLSTKQALRRVGLQVYPFFEQTLPGKAIFAFAGGNFSRVASLAAKGYGVALSRGSAEAVVTGNRVIARLRNVWTFPNCYQVGVWEGAMKTCGIDGTVKLQEHSLANVDLELTWD